VLYCFKMTRRRGSEVNFKRLSLERIIVLDLNNLLSPVKPQIVHIYNAFKYCFDLVALVISFIRHFDKRHNV
jgi:hypothetical protein